MCPKIDAPPPPDTYKGSFIVGAWVSRWVYLGACFVWHPVTQCQTQRYTRVGISRDYSEGGFYERNPRVKNASTHGQTGMRTMACPYVTVRSLDQWDVIHIRPYHIWWVPRNCKPIGKSSVYFQ